MDKEANMTGCSGTIDWLLYTKNGHAPPKKNKGKKKGKNKCTRLTD